MSSPRTIGKLRTSLLRATTPALRRAGERSCSSGKVGLIARDDEASEYLFAVTIGSAARFEVHLWPEDSEWECSCEVAACAHAYAALLALEGGLDSVAAAEEPPRLVAEVESGEGRLSLQLSVRDGESLVPFGGTLPPGLEIPVEVTRLLRLSRDWIEGRIPGRGHRVFLVAMRSLDELLLDGEPIEASRIPLDQVARVEATGVGYRLSLADPPQVSKVWEGDPTLVLAEGILRPRGFGKLTTLQKHQLARPLLFSEHELPRLTAEWIPALRKAIEVVQDDRVPQTGPGGLHTLLELNRRGDCLEVCARIVYGDPPVAELRGEELIPLGGLQSIPARNRRAEREALANLNGEMGLRAGQRLRLEGEPALRFVAERLPSFRGLVLGAEVAAQFTLRGDSLRPELHWGEGLNARFASGEALVGASRVLAAWRRGETVVPLAGGGFGSLPVDWLDEHGDSLELLLGSVGDGACPTHLAPLALSLGARIDEKTAFDPRPLLATLQGNSPLPEPTLPEALEGVLRDYQAAGFRWLHFLGHHGLGGVLADDMGLGKTLQALALLAASSEPGPSLVVAPTSVLRNWQREAQRFVPDLDTLLLHGPRRRERFELLSSGRTAVGVTSYALLRRDIELLSGLEWQSVILDEAQAIKNPDSQTARAARSLRARRRIALTGTPIENHLGELWSLMEFLNPGFFGSRKRFAEQLGDRAKNGEAQAIRAIRNRVRPFVLRRLKSEVAPELPPRTETVIRCPMAPKQRASYDAVLRAAREGLPSESGPRRMQILAALTRLRQAACDASLLPTSGEEEASGKLDVFSDMLEEILEEGHRVLVFSQWTSLLDRVEPRLEAAGVAWLRIDGATRDRQTLVDRFQAEDGPPVFLLSLKAAGTGLNLTAADHVFHLDPWWNPAAEGQASDRAHRIGQTRPVFIWKLVSEETVEEAILDLQERKRAVAEAILSGQDGGAALTKDDLEALLT